MYLVAGTFLDSGAIPVNKQTNVGLQVNEEEMGN